MEKICTERLEQQTGANGINNANVVNRCLRWSKIVKELYDFEEEKETSVKKLTRSNLRLKPPKRFD